MSDDSLIAGAAAPVGRRWIRSTAMLDAAWATTSAVALIVSSFSALVDLPNASLRTGDEPLRFFVQGLPVIAIVAAAIGAIRGSVTLVAVATGVLAPSIALAGSLGLSLLLDDAAAFADVGVAISVGAALFGGVMLVRWFVYHPLPLLGDQSRPVPRAGWVLASLGVALAAVLLATTIIGDTSWSASSVAQTSVLLTVAVVVVASGVTRTIAAAWLACAACAAQCVAVLVVKAEQSTIALDSDLVLRTGVPGLVALLVTGAAAVVAAVAARPDPDPDPSEDASESWRWHVDD